MTESKKDFSEPQNSITSPSYETTNISKTHKVGWFLLWTYLILLLLATYAEFTGKNWFYWITLSRY